MTGAPVNLVELGPDDAGEEHFVTLVESANVKIERIVSSGQASPAGFWYDQPWAEWVMVLAGSAGLRFDGEAEIMVLRAGDHVLIPARQKHRVEWTDASRATVWLAVHYAESG
ncbi:cupin domain-containing protein [Methylocapsa polymorpha]|uniref:Cupin domain-containing protein n=1 Tax=Methylocapsa polymorpha TaxID=3080828 RepID=A0ABZ0HUC0_9HYPH|nr:cupin domain-containing protein [Methylocapsa sp. RX1]